LPNCENWIWRNPRGNWKFLALQAYGDIALAQGKTQ